MSNQWQLDERLLQDSYQMGHMEGSVLLLMKNALFSWFVIVPYTEETEFFKLSQALQLNVLNQINRISDFIEKDFQVDKLNVATIGNIVSQMHIHVVGRRADDPCWPGVVWGCNQFAGYDDNEVALIRGKLIKAGLITIE